MPLTEANNKLKKNIQSLQALYLNLHKEYNYSPGAFRDLKALRMRIDLHLSIVVLCICLRHYVSASSRMILISSQDMMTVKSSMKVLKSF